MWSQLPFGEKLKAELGSPRRVRRLSSSPRSRVWRAELSGTPVVVKQLVGGPEAAEGYAREAAALQLASRVDPPVVPKLLGVDPGERVLVLEHLDHQGPREDWVIDYAAALARLHAAPGAGAAGSLPTWSGPTQDDADSFLRLARTIDTAIPPGVRTELEGLVHRLTRTPGYALLHGDPCPGNDMHTSQGVRFIDFEQAALGNGIVELAYLRIGFPTCWCATAPTPALLDAAENAYRSTWRDTTGTEVPGDLADACAGWLLRGDALVQRAQRGTIDHLGEIPNRDWGWGTATARQRLAHRLRVVGQMTAESSELNELGRLAAAMRESTLTRWPELQPLPSQRP
ncbi:phosphotransferase [Streptomyces roseoverticillatus]|uniref:phosphotransferase n=1 Tax=Streptomyces roseoverticillatus TaxID=66429 RepID=UPI001F2306B9|nr:phosphotransferase [Streptomyces roseoverticillatus]MCF3103103.1 phosphotransferase [Streptomyces roseoverticillatus]